MKVKAVGAAFRNPATGDLTPVVLNDGAAGHDGKSAYQLWLDMGNVGSFAQYMASLDGPPGNDGKSAYQLWLASGHTGTMADFMNSLAGAPGKSAWTPIFAGEQDGVRTLLKVIDWMNGTGTKPDTGMYLGTSGYVTSKATAFNFNSAKRIVPFTAVTAAVTGIATFDMTSAGFSAAPVVVVTSVVPNVITGPNKAVVSGPTTKDGTKVTVTAAALLTGVVSALVGASVTIIAIEA